MAWGAAIAVAGGIAGSLISAGDRRAQREALERGWAELDKLGLPPDLSKRVLLEKFYQAGILSPELESDMNVLEESKVSLITEDPEIRNKQIEALSRMSQLGRTGLSAEDTAAANDLRRDIGTDLTAKLGQLQQSYQSRGLGGSGMEQGAAMQSIQSSAEEANRQGDRLAAMAAANAREASMGALDQLSNFRGQDFDVAVTKAQAADDNALRSWNAANARQTRNIAARNQASASNLDNAQRIANMNTVTSNTESLRQNQAKRDNWRDNLDYRSAYSNQAQQQAQQHGRDADRTAQAWTGAASGVATGVTGYQQQQNQNQQNQLDRDNDRRLYELKFGKGGNDDPYGFDSFS